MAFDTPKVKEPEKKAAPITPESDEVKAAGQLELDRQREKSGRGSMFFTNPMMKTGFAGGFGSKTGSV